MRSVSATQGGSNPPNGRASCFGLIVQRLGPMTVDHEMRFRLPLRPPLNRTLAHQVRAGAL